MRFALVTAAVMAACVLVSCLGIEDTFTINDNGSGRLVFEYKISQVFKNLDKTEGDAAIKEAPLPLTEADVRKALAKNDGVTVVSVRQWEDDTDIHVQGEVAFKTVAALNRSDLFEMMPVSLTKENGKTVFTQVISEQREPLDQKDLDAYEGLIDGYQITVTVKAPRAITAASLGVVSPDKRSVTYTLSLADYMKLSEKTELRVSW